MEEESGFRSNPDKVDGSEQKQSHRRVRQRGTRGVPLRERIMKDRRASGTEDTVQEASGNGDNPARSTTRDTLGVYGRAARSGLRGAVTGFQEGLDEAALNLAAELKTRGSAVSEASNQELSAEAENDNRPVWPNIQLKSSADGAPAPGRLGQTADIPAARGEAGAAMTDAAQEASGNGDNPARSTVRDTLGVYGRAARSGLRGAVTGFQEGLDEAALNLAAELKTRGSAVHKAPNQELSAGADVVPQVNDSERDAWPHLPLKGSPDLGLAGRYESSLPPRDQKKGGHRRSVRPPRKHNNANTGKQ
jgi:hypothetical protein